ncbi:serine/threonine phosphatase [Gloeocapsopsis dulcis]|uniref:Serine/threonine protein phosphatase n=1 Tax=Gloeocapsopsis dulcis AAB1 = 1H9 TaxID=1433147 RepID=A0A6N8FS80_9CHRO|nr:serine/threonine phosphatase [Gloeocapsopsis dulcis]MUL35801.1 serine/threonine protein phosphatase [Gloeocapsopsis dulcis AAB1 = 1H9]WNN87732.1 serine/threonine phosphatase [Gloeocapsopsis dulcis]
MLICPQCQFENPTHNKFCQQCGTSLTHKPCAECGTTVALNQERCHNCNAVTGTIWLAIAQNQSSLIASTISQTTCRTDTAATVDNTSNSAEEQNVPLPFLPKPEVGAFIDQQQRYQILDLLTTSADQTEICWRVLDCQPLQLSPLLAGAAAVAEIPTIAKTYLTLQSQLHQVVPAVQDTWQSDDVQFVLIEDRSHWQQLVTLWQDNQTSPLQILHWLHEMMQLWVALEPWQCRQSLLELANLRVDEDGVLALQRLYGENAGTTLQDLGNLWYQLFQESQRTQFGLVVELINTLQSGSIQSTDELRSHLESIAAELQDQFAPTTTSDSAITLDDVDDALQEEDTQIYTESMPTLILPVTLFSLEEVGSTDVGRQREHNEDFFGIETTIHKLDTPGDRTLQARGLYILCDGMGGHAGGEVASKLAVDSLKQYFETHWQSDQLPDENTIREAVQLANQAIYDLNQQDARAGVGRMGTTLVMVLMQNTQVAVAHVGDSRLYRLSRQRGLEQVTTDHEVGQREILRGIEPHIAYGRPDAYQLTQALGPRDASYVSPDVQFLELSEDTLLILTSDGLSDNDLMEHHWHTHLEPLLSSEANLNQGLANLIDLANHYNGHDNITAILIRAKVHPNRDAVEATIPST